MHYANLGRHDLIRGFVKRIQLSWRSLALSMAVPSIMGVYWTCCILKVVPISILCVGLAESAILPLRVRTNNVSQCRDNLHNTFLFWLVVLLLTHCVNAVLFC